MSNDTRIYEKELDCQRREIRILRLEAGSYSADLSCNLKTASLDDAPYYEALSYAWGPTSDPQTISVNGTTITVTRYLEIALRHLRDSNTDRFLWIDAVCIDQKNVAERNSQVVLMGEIYRSAERVLVWIGEADDTSDMAFDLMPMIDINFIESPDASTVWSFFYNATRRPYMSRLWVIQEFVLARQDPLVLCGHKQALWSCFMSAYKTLALDFFTQIDMVQEIATGRPPSVLAKLRYDLFDELRTTISQDGGADLRQLFIMSRSSIATDPRDRVYGLLQMLDMDDKKHFNVDYNKPTAVIYAEAMSLIFKQGGGPYFLSGMWCPSIPNPAIPDLPSWVPDFTSQTSQLTGSRPSSISFHPAFPRSVSGVGADADNGKVLDDLKTLKVAVLHVDLVENVVHFENRLENCVAQLEEVEQRVLAARSKAIENDKLRSFFEKFRSSEPLWRTLVSGKSSRSGYDVAPDSYEVMYNELRQRPPTRNSQDPSSSSEYYLALESHLPNRTFFTTKCGFFGLGMPAVQKGDEVTIWFGATVPFVVRQSAQAPTKCSLIGPAYVAGIMEGQMVDELYCDDLIDSKILYVI